jgi:hypothetical protein
MVAPVMNRRSFITSILGVAGVIGVGVLPTFAAPPAPKPISSLTKINSNVILGKIKQTIERVGEAFIGETNDEITQTNLRVALTDALEIYTKTQTIYNFTVICDETLNPPTIIEQRALKGRVYVQLNRSINYHVIEFTLA